MTNMLVLSAAQLATALIIVSALSILGTLAFDSVRAYFNSKPSKDFPFDIAVAPTPGGWHNNNAFFDKITEFYNGISR